MDIKLQVSIDPPGNQQHLASSSSSRDATYSAPADTERPRRAAGRISSCLRFRHGYLCFKRELATALLRIDSVHIALFLCCYFNIRSPSNYSCTCYNRSHNLRSCTYNHTLNYSCTYNRSHNLRSCTYNHTLNNYSWSYNPSNYNYSCSYTHSPSNYNYSYNYNRSPSNYNYNCSYNCTLIHFSGIYNIICELLLWCHDRIYQFYIKCFIFIRHIKLFDEFLYVLYHYGKQHRRKWRKFFYLLPFIHV
ncbi:hypothetical protein WMY93_026883 [Mugilogobius chulae]|uniref:Uncharacterized protein n=1 Tax=Mugilogobius chulae TaxID=88201 RepID=A0AAW0NBD1_9GOBI